MNPQLQNLRDIHLPPPTSVWPLAPGWWVLAGVMAMLLVAALWLFRRQRQRHKQNAWRREALAEIALLREMPSAQQALTQLSILIRRVAITQLPRQDVAALHGERWLAFLDLSLGEGFRAAGGALLITAPYQSPSTPVALNKASLNELLILIENWVARLENQRMAQSS